MAAHKTCSPKLSSPAYLAHLVLLTSKANFQELTSFYKTFLGAEATYENDWVAFLSYDVEHHRIAIVALSDVGPKQDMSSGLDHIAFAYNSLHDLSKAYQERKALNIRPTWCINHGPTTSMYYKDPDGNKIEFQVGNMTNEGAMEFVRSKAFSDNPVGVEFDPEEFCRRVGSGEDEEKIKARPDS